MRLKHLGLVLLWLALLAAPWRGAASAFGPPWDTPLGDPSTRAIYLILDGQKRLVPDMVTLKAFGFVESDIRWDRSPRLAQTPPGPNLLPFSAGDLIRDTKTGELYLLASGRRALTTLETLRACGWDEASARDVSPALISAMVAGPPLPALYVGSLIRSEGDDCTYLLHEGRHWLPDEHTLEACGWHERDIQELDPQLMLLIPEREFVPSLYDGCLLEGQDEEGERRLYILDGGRHLIPDEATLLAYGWDETRLWRIAPELLAAIPEGAAVARAEKGQNVFSYNYWGQCTWYVAERRIAPSYLDAKDWLADAEAKGYATGQRPMPGAVLVYGTGRGSHGHVAYVERTYADGSFILSDGNVCGWDCVETRLTRLEKEISVLGFIYWKYD